MKRQKLSQSSSAEATTQPVSLFDDDGGPPPSSSAGPAPVKLHGGEVFTANLATGGQNSKLHVGLNDLVDDERFPGTSVAPSITGQHFSAEDAGILLGAFLEKLVPHYTDISITEEKLMALLDHRRIGRLTKLTRETIVSCLLHMGLLLFKTATSFFFSPPSIARLISCIRAGRKEVVSILKRRQYKEIPLRELLQKPQLKTSPCRIEFHLREMLGSAEIIEMTDTTIGPLVKLVKR